MGTKVKEPKVFLPSSYYTEPKDTEGRQKRFKEEHFANYKLLTLFYIFYNLPKDFYQAHAAQELHRRGWKYHAEFKYWFSKSVAVGQPEKFVYFNHTDWAVVSFPQQDNAQAQAIWQNCLGENAYIALSITGENYGNNKSNITNSTGSNGNTPTTGSLANSNV